MFKGVWRRGGKGIWEERVRDGIYFLEERGGGGLGVVL